jgi:soluble lytic murein transglycosylase-like protein
MIPDWAMRLPMNLIYSKAIDAGLEPFIVAAIVYRESSGFVYAVKFEPKFKYIHRAEHFAKYQRITVETEVNLQKHSFGLMQVMGGTARWRGFNGALPALYKPENNLYWGCYHLSRLKDKWPEKKDYISAYNQGSPRIDPKTGEYCNQEYVDYVLKKYEELKCP